MQRSRRSLKSPGNVWGWALAVGLIAAPAAFGDEQGSTKLDIRWSPIIDLHFFARAIEADPKAEKPPGLKPLLDAIGRVNSVLGSDPLSWGVLEGSLAGCQTAEDVRKAFADLPEKYTPKKSVGAKDAAPKEIELRSLAMDLASALQQTEPYYLAEPASKNEEVVNNARLVLNSRFHGREADCLGYLILNLGGRVPEATIPVYLVSTMMFPGAVTQILPGRSGGVCFVAVRGVPQWQLVEVVLHESTHAMDVLWGEDSALAKLRTRLSPVLPAGSRNLDDIPHTLMFVQSGETVRRVLTPKHQHYGDVSRYYSKVYEATKAVREPWMEYLDGKISSDQAIDKIVEAARQIKP